MLKNKNLKDKTVFLRADLNVPLKDGMILDDFRLEQLKPTINELMQRGATILLATHIGRPTDRSTHLSTQRLIPWFEEKGYPIRFVDNLADIPIKTDQSKIILLENMRFFPGEQSTDKQERKKFVAQLAPHTDYYINDAFGLMHRNDTSITDLAHAFPVDSRDLGLLVQKELQYLQPIVNKPEHPFMLIIGGNKLSSKIHLINALLPTLDTLAWCPAPVFTLLYAQGNATGDSFIDHAVLDQAKEIIRKKSNNQRYPVDYQVSERGFDGPYSYVKANEFPATAVGIAIGPKTCEQYVHTIKQAKLIVYNGLMGMIDKPETHKSVKALFTAMGQAEGTSIIAGGDSVAAARKLDIKGINFLSSGGGATLAFLSGQYLPGLEPFKKSIK